MQVSVAKVSVIIPCYNHAHYLSTSIESVLEQDHRNIEIIVVDDGSTDNTKEVATKYPAVKYIYKTNEGLPAARNTGIDHSTGQYLVFLDSDDWLLPGCISVNLSFIENEVDKGFVFGAFMVLDEQKNTSRIFIFNNENNCYQNLLLFNYIQMTAAVMYPRFIFDEFRFNPALKSCEDWDLYLRICRKYTVKSHTTPVAVYRKYGEGMSSNLKVMLESGLMVLQQQFEFVKNANEKKLLREGIYSIKKRYSGGIYNQMVVQLKKENKTNKNLHSLLWQYYPYLYFKFVIRRLLWQLNLY